MIFIGIHHRGNLVLNPNSVIIVIPTFLSSISGLEWREGKVGQIAQSIAPLYFLERKRSAGI